MRVFESLIGYMKDSSAETQSLKATDLAEIRTAQAIGKYTGFTSVALMVATVVTPFFSILALPFFAFTALVGRDVYLLTSNMEEAWNKNIEFGVGHEIKTAATAESFFKALTKNTVLFSSFTTICPLPISILDLDVNDLFDIHDAVMANDDPNPRAVGQQAANNPNFGLDGLFGENDLNVDWNN